MVIRKSLTDFIGVYKSLLLEDMVRQYGRLSFHKDFKKLETRAKNEGISFFTKTLPSLAKAIDKALVDGVFTCPSHFKKMRGTAYPLFLNGLLKRVFCEDGTVKIDPCVSAVSDLRQILYLLYKYELPYKEEHVNTIIESFKEVDRGLGWQRPNLSNCANLILVRARTLLRELLKDIRFDDLVPGHGPGAVADGKKNWEKWEFSVLYENLHRAFPYYQYFTSSIADIARNIPWFDNLDRVPSGIAKLVIVPKDSRGPRLISMEPSEFQYIQQGIMKKIYDHIEDHRLTRGHVNFTDQTINRELAQLGSWTGEYVTLDMKEASDRIALWLTDYLFNGTPMDNVIRATRTEATELPSGEVLLFRKVAPMGSSLCFPIMALVHWSLAVATLCVTRTMSLSKALKTVYVYGDDIIVKGKNHAPLLTYFPEFHLKFNESKCCTTGSFRESCGMDAFLGQEVTPLKIKKILPRSPYDASTYVAYIDYVNNLWNRAYYSTSNALAGILHRVYGKIPIVHCDSDVPGYKLTRFPVSFQSGTSKRYNKKLHRFETYQRRTVNKKHVVDCDRCEYHRTLLMIHNRDSSVLEDNGYRAGVYTVPRSIKLKMGWSHHAIR